MIVIDLFDNISFVRIRYFFNNRIKISLKVVLLGRERFYAVSHIAHTIVGNK